MLTVKVVRRIRDLTGKVSDRTASIEEIRELADRIRQTGLTEDFWLPAELRKGGFRSLEDFAANLATPRADAVVKELQTTALGITLGFTMNKALAEG